MRYFFILLFGLSPSTPILSQEGVNFYEKQRKKFPEDTFRQINDSIDLNLYRYGQRIREAKAIIQRAESIDLDPVSRESTFPLFEKENPEYLIQQTELLGNDFERVEPFEILSQNKESEIEQENLELNEFRSSKARSGLYVLPLLGIQFPQTVDWHSVSGKVPLEQGSGIAIGLIAGLQIKNLFFEVDSSFLQNRINGFKNSASFQPNPFDNGDVETFNFIANAGVKFPVGKRADFDIGAGIGLARQNFSMNLAGVGISDDRASLAMQIMIGMEYNITQNFLSGLEYKSIWISKMNDFSKRNIQLIQIFGGYSF